MSSTRSRSRPDSSLEARSDFGSVLELFDMLSRGLKKRVTSGGDERNHATVQEGQ